MTEHYHSSRYMYIHTNLTGKMNTDENTHRNEIMRTICVWCERVVQKPNIDMDRIIQLGLDIHKTPLWLDTTLTPCNTCIHEFDLVNMHPAELRKEEVRLFKIMVERMSMVMSSLWSTNENVYRSVWRADRVHGQMPERMFLAGSQKLDINVDMERVVVPSVVWRGSSRSDQLQLPTPPSSPECEEKRDD